MCGGCVSASPVTSKPKNTINEGFLNRLALVSCERVSECSCKKEYVIIGGDILWSRADLLSVLVPF